MLSIAECNRANIALTSHPDNPMPNPSVQTAPEPSAERGAYQIRPATSTDFPAAEALLRECGLTLNDVAAQWGPQYGVALDGSGRMIGMAGVEVYGPVGLFRSAAVGAEWRGRGVGAALTEDRLAWARAAGLTDLYLLTQTAAEYWPRFGFVRTERDAAPAPLQKSAEWAGGCPASAVAMRLPLHS